VTSKQWIRGSLLSVVVCAGAVAGLNYRINAFGVFGDVRGKTYRSYLNQDREAKYLYSFNYIPANFDGFLVGSSISGNWDTGKIQSARTYNLSIVDATMTEEKLLADNILARGKVSLAIFCVYPRMVHTHGRRTGYMQPKDYWTTLGSEQLLKEYRSEILADRGHLKPFFDESGVLDFSNLERNADHMKAVYRIYHRDPIVIDETAFSEYAALVEEARSHGARIAAFVPPHYIDVWNTPDYQDFMARMKTLFQPGELVIDFNDKPYDEFRSNADNFYDGVHIATSRTGFLVAELNARLSAPKAAMAASAP
jgi:hypothetical protein